LAPGGSFAFTAAVDLGNQSRETGWLWVAGKDSRIGAVAELQHVEHEAGEDFPRREYQTSSWASCGHGFVRYFEGA
jgi:hypothetical protein